MKYSDIERRFMHHTTTDQQVAAMQRIRDDARGLAATLDSFCPDSRELSLAITYLEQVMFANAAIVRPNLGEIEAIKDITQRLSKIESKNAVYGTPPKRPEFVQCPQHGQPIRPS